jgi:DNA-binding FadR family transcriptional regulator
VIKNIHGHIVDLLGKAIVSGRYVEGSIIPPEPALGEKFGVSRTVIREAIKTLSAKGMIVTGRKVGSRVLSRDSWNWFDPDIVGWQGSAGLTPEFLRDLQELRRVVEPAAVRLAAERATSADIAEIESAYAGMKNAIEKGGDYVTHDLRFHNGLMRAAQNRLLTQMSKALNALLRTSFELSTMRSNGPALSLPMHRAVMDAIKARDPPEAERAILQLIDGARADIEAVLDSPKKLPRLSRPPRRLKAV